MQVLLTMDVDWAPDYMIEDFLNLLPTSSPPLLVFTTHDSTFLREVRAEPNIEIGFHPNLDAGSTQGSSEEEIFHNLRSLAVSGRAVRTHGNYFSTNFAIRMAGKYGIEFDLSQFQPRTSIARPFEFYYGEQLLKRIPYTWEDGYEAAQEGTWLPWLRRRVLNASEHMVVNFHPVHTYLNTTRYSDYALVKRILGPVHTWTSNAAAEYVNKGASGTRVQLQELTHGNGDIEFTNLDDYWSQHLSRSEPV